MAEKSSNNEKTRFSAGHSCRWAADRQVTISSTAVPWRVLTMTQVWGVLVSQEKKFFYCHMSILALLWVKTCKIHKNIIFFFFQFFFRPSFRTVPKLSIKPDNKPQVFSVTPGYFPQNGQKSTFGCRWSNLSGPFVATSHEVSLVKVSTQTGSNWPRNLRITKKRDFLPVTAAGGCRPACSEPAHLSAHVCSTYGPSGKSQLPAV